jgi:uncharacterized protein YceK
MKRIAMVLAMVLLAGGCASTSSVPLPGAGDPERFVNFRHPATGDVQRCERVKWCDQLAVSCGGGGRKGWWDVMAADKCKSALEAQGYRPE